MSVGDLVSFVLYTTFIGGSIAGLGDIYGQVQRQLAPRSGRVGDLDEEEESSTGVKQANFKERLNLIKFNFHYPTRPEMEVLSSLSFYVNPGEKVALAGPFRSWEIHDYSTFTSIL